MSRYRSRQESAPTITEVILGVIGAAGILGIAAVAPGCVRLLAARTSRVRPQWYIGRALRRAEDRGLVRISGGQGRIQRVRLTEKGERTLAAYTLSKRTVIRPRKWDGRWRLIMFDVPERRRHARDALRRMLQDVGFYRLQESVWVYPFPCDDLMELIRVAANLHPLVVRYALVESIENDAVMRQHFDV